METVINIFIQARMSSTRFPGKILSSLHNKPLIQHIVDSAKRVNGINKVVVLTSMEASDDLLISYLKKIHCDYFRGNLEDVFCRFQSSMKVFPCDYFVRLSADSPLIDDRLIEWMIKKINRSDDIISNVITRTFPKGQSVEIIKADTFLSVDKADLTQDEREHVFPYFYRNHNRYKIHSIENKSDQNHLSFCVDTLQDLERLSSSKNVYRFERDHHET